MCFREDERRGRILLVVSHPEINVSLLSIVDLDDSRKAASSRGPRCKLTISRFSRSSLWDNVTKGENVIQSAPSDRGARGLE